MDFTFLDPHFNSSWVTRNHAYMVFDTLYGLDSSFSASPQMAAGRTVASDGKLWRIRLHDGLRWHDGAPVPARDCVASIQRWAVRDSYGSTLMQATDELSAPDDKTIQFRLKSPFPTLPAALGTHTALRGIGAGPGQPRVANQPEAGAPAHGWVRRTRSAGAATHLRRHPGPGA